MQDDFRNFQDESTQGQKHSATSDNAILLEFVGGRNKKGYVYGLRQLSDEFVASLMPRTQFELYPTVDFKDVTHNLYSDLVEKNNVIQVMRIRMDEQDAGIERFWILPDVLDRRFEFRHLDNADDIPRTARNPLLMTTMTVILAHSLHPLVIKRYVLLLLLDFIFY